MRTTRTLACVLALLPLAPRAQEDVLPFTVEIVERSWPALSPLHSTAFAQWDGRWLFVTGRTNGLHGLFGDNPFPNEFANDEVVVADPATGGVWTASVAGLPAELADRLRVTNAQFVQDGPTLYLVGGYGHSQAAGGKITFPTLTALDVPSLMAAVMSGLDLAPHVRDGGTDARLAVTGGHLVRVGERYVLAGGQRFDGEYLGAFIQAYTEALRSFRLTDDGAAITLDSFAEVADADALHRRDGNLAPVVLPDGTEGFALYGGVFHPETGLAVPHPIYVRDGVPTVDSAFAQRLGHYTAPVLPLHDGLTGAMHTVFFGGMGQFYVDEATGAFVEDARLPFVDDVGAVSRAADGTTVETVLPFDMPGLLGTNAAFLLAPGVPQTAGGVVRLRDLAGRTLVGHIAGGIEADGPNFSTSRAASRVFEVYVTPSGETAAEPDPTAAPLALSAPAPSPARDEARLTLALAHSQTVRVEVFDAVGRRVALVHDGALAAGLHPLAWQTDGAPSGVYVVRATAAEGVATRRVVVAR